MAQSGYTPLSLYYSTTPTQQPAAGDLTNGELAINITDGKLYYKDNAGAVKLLASNAASTPVTTISFGSTGLTPNTATSGAVSVAGTLGVGYGGTGYASYTAGDLLYASGTTSFAKLGLGTTNYVLTSSGTAPQWVSTLPVGSGGTGQTAYTDGQLLIGNTATGSLSKATLTQGSGVTITNGNGTITIAATGSGGTVTSVGWTGGIVSVATATTTPAFTIAGTSGGIPYFSSGTTWASSGALAANAIVLGGGAGAAPATTTTGTGVVTAIGNAVNTANGLVTQTATLTASALLLGGGSGTGISSTTTGTGVVTALGNNANATGGFATTNGAATFTNKRIDPRVNSTTSSATAVTPDIASYDMYAWTAQAATLTINAPTGTPVDGDKLIFRILDNGSSQTISWNGTYTAIGVTLPTATTISKMTYVGCIYNAANTRWDVIAVTTQV